MSLLAKLKKSILNKLLTISGSRETQRIIHQYNETQIVLLSKQIERQLSDIQHIEDFKQIEFKAFSQWGDDGIISWLLNHLRINSPYFIEFGVQNYLESNTRYLLLSRNASGLIIDGDSTFTDEIKNDSIYWRFDLKVLNAFITKENINELLSQNVPSKNVDILSIDIDGNDYWIFNEIHVISPKLIICEYNGALGDSHKITVPYDSSFVRSQKHYSHLYFGMSIQALIDLANKKGYEFAGTNSNGNNAYFVRNDLSQQVLPFIKNKSIYLPKFRENRSRDGIITPLQNDELIKLIGEMDFFELNNSKLVKFKNL